MKKTILLCLAAITGTAALHAQSGNLGVGTTTPGSTLTVNGSMAAHFRSITATTYTMAADDYYLLWNGTATGTITLPASVANMKGRMYIIRNNTNQTLYVNANGSELTSLGAQLTVPSMGGVDLMHTGATSGTTWDVMQFRSSQTKGELIHSANLDGKPVSGADDTVNVGVTKDINGCIDTFTTIRPTLVVITAVGYATHNPSATSCQGEFILTVNDTAKTTAYYTSFNAPSGFTRLPGIGVLTYSAILPAATHTIKLRIKAWGTTGNTDTYHMYNIDAVTAGYAGATTTSDKDALKPRLMVNAYTQ